jgi:hypothetical protein
MTQQGSRAVGEDGGHPVAFATDLPVPDRVDAPVDAVKPTGLQPPVDGRAAQEFELPRSHNPMLRAGQRGNFPIRLPFCPHSMVICTMIVHRGE